MVMAALIPGAVAGVIDIAKQVLGQWIPDTAERDKAAAELAVQLQQADLIALQGQIDINKIEAGSGSLFIAGWRPAAGWVCAAALALLFIGYGVWPVIAASAGLAYLPAPSDTILTLLGTIFTGMMGLRTVEKWGGVAEGQSSEARQTAVDRKAASHPPVVIKK